SGHLSKPATGESAADDPAAERGPIRTGIWGNQTGSRHKASGADSLRRGQRPDDDDLEGQGERTPAGSSKSMRPLRSEQIFSIVFVAIFLLHLPLLRLSFFWDEAGYYIPAAYDLVHSHSLIPTSTLDTGHPPLSAAYLALWFSLSGWKPAVARIA